MTLNFNDLPTDIKKMIFKINKDEQEIDKTKIHHKLLMKKLHLYFYYNQYDEDRYPHFRCADMIDNNIVYY